METTAPPSLGARVGSGCERLVGVWVIERAGRPNAGRIPRAAHSVMVDAGFLKAALAGLTGSLHCLAMCGGYVAAADASAVQPLRPARALRVERLVAHAGRLSTYLLLGAACSWLLIKLAGKPRGVEMTEDAAEETTEETTEETR